MNAQAHDSTTVVDLEAHVLGSILVNGGHFARIADLLSPDDFAESWHSRIFGIMADLAKAGTPPGLLAVRPYLGTDEITPEMTANQYLARLAADGGAVPAQLLDHARHIRRFADYRRMRDLCASASTLAGQFGGGKAPAEIAMEIVSALDPIIAAERSAGVRRVSIADAAASAAAAAFDRMAGKPTGTISTGLRDLDKRIGGLEPGEFSIVAGRPSMGKTAVSLEIARNVAAAGKGVLYFSIEMVGEQLAYRVLSSIIFDRTAPGDAPVYYSNISHGRMTDAEAEQVDTATRDLRNVPLLIEQEAGLTMAQIGARTRRAKQQFAAEGIELGLVVIDHLGLVRASNRYSGNRTNEMGEISATCKAMAKELGVHVMGLSQFNRGVEGRGDKRPALSDLRESGNLEQDADLVMGAFREAYYLQNSSEPEDLTRLLSVKRKLELLVLKQRQGPVGPVSLFADMGANAIRNFEGSY